MDYVEPGRYPLIIFIKVKISIYWAELLVAHDCNLTDVMYRYFYKKNCTHGKIYERYT